MTLRAALLGFAVALAATWAWKTFMEQQVYPLTSAEIVAFEFARTPQGASEWLSQWEESGTLKQAARSVYLDFVFLLVYPAPFYFACRALVLVGRARFQRWAKILSRVVWWAAAFDAIENLGLLYSLSVSPETVVTYSTAFFAALKFGVLTLTLLFVLVATCVVLVRAKGKLNLCFSRQFFVYLNSN